MVWIPPPLASAYDLIGPNEPTGDDLEVSSDQLIRAYELGMIKGALPPDPADVRQVYSESQFPVFEVAVAGTSLEGSGAGKVSVPFLAVLNYEPEFGRYEAQTTGDCVSHSTRNSGMIDYCVDVTRGETEYRGRFATENIYGARGHGGQGAQCVTLARYTSRNGRGGFLVRKAYGEGGQSVDLSRYNSRIGHNWGRPGTPSWLNSIASQNPCETVSNVRTLEGCRDAIANGYGVSMCSGLGFSSRRDEFGVASQRGGWSHAMAWVGCNDDRSSGMHRKYGTCFLVQNSWGVWNGGPKAYDQPDGSFWISQSVAERMLRGGGGWIVSSVVGFKRRELDYLLI